MRAGLVLGVAVTFGPARLPSQTTTFWFDVGAGQSRWATTGTVSSRLSYGSLGVRGAWQPPGAFGVAGHLSGGLGSAEDATSAGWLSADASLSLRRVVGSTLAGVALEGWGVRYDQITRYDAVGIRLLPTLDWRSGSWSIRGRGELALGNWQLSGPVEGGPPVPVPRPEREVASGSLRLLGGMGELLHASGPVWVRAAPAAFLSRGRVPEYWQVAGEGEVGFVAGPVTLSAGARWLSAVPADSAPRTASVGALVRGRVALNDRWGITLYYDGRPWDPMHAVQRGTLAYAGIEWRAAPGNRTRLPVVELGPWTGTGRTVRFRLDARAERIELLGDFSGWQPLPMSRRGLVWEAEVVVPPGTHQFGFLLDGTTWMVPSHAPGIVTDGWQRQNATITIAEPAP